MPAEAFDGIEAFSHVEAIYHFDRVPDAAVECGSSHPSGNTAWPKVGILAWRGKGRPNRLGVCIAELVSRQGKTIKVRGLDAIDGTTVQNIKPGMPEFLPRVEVRQPTWSRELRSNYWG